MRSRAASKPAAAVLDLRARRRLEPHRPGPRLACAGQPVHIHNLDGYRALYLFDVLRQRFVVGSPEIFANVFTTTYGLTFLLVGNGVGAIIAFCVFSFTAVSPPLVVDRDVDVVTALTTSVRAVAANPQTMLAWMVVIGMDLAVSFVTFHVALLVLFPILGHTTWHLYRKLIV